MKKTNDPIKSRMHYHIKDLGAEKLRILYVRMPKVSSPYGQLIAKKLISTHVIWKMSDSPFKNYKLKDVRAMNHAVIIVRNHSSMNEEDIKAIKEHIEKDITPIVGNRYIVVSGRVMYGATYQIAFYRS